MAKLASLKAQTRLLDRRPADQIRARLVAAGLATTAAQAAAIRLLAVVPLLLALGLGIAKFNVGVSRHRPVGFLGVLLAAASVVTLFLLFRPARTTRAPEPERGVRGSGLARGIAR